jgi:hypothetical protein
LLGSISSLNSFIGTSLTTALFSPLHHV